jgi:hypothetical protein
MQIPAGSDIRIDITATADVGGPYDLTGAKLISSLSRRPGQVVVLSHRNAAAGGADTQIRATDPVNGLLSIWLIAAETIGLRGVYAWDVVARSPGGAERVVYLGELEFLPRVSAPIA